MDGHKKVLTDISRYQVLRTGYLLIFLGTGYLVLVPSDISWYGVLGTVQCTNSRNYLVQ